MKQPQTYGDVNEGDVFKSGVETEIWYEDEGDSDSDLKTLSSSDSEEAYVEELRVDSISERGDGLLKVTFTLFGESGQGNRLTTTTSVFGPDTELADGWKTLIRRK